MIVDSGTTDTYLSRAVSAEFKKKFKSMTGITFKNQAMDLTEDQVAGLPTILIQLTGTSEFNDPNAKGESVPVQIELHKRC